MKKTRLWAALIVAPIAGAIAVATVTPAQATDDEQRRGHGGYHCRDDRDRPDRGGHRDRDGQDVVQNHDGVRVITVESHKRRPCVRPSSSPSGQPSDTPSSPPSEIPSDEPSTEPSGTPSEEPSGEPSEEPSAEPSESVPAGVPTTYNPSPATGAGGGNALPLTGAPTGLVFGVGAVLLALGVAAIAFVRRRRTSFEA